MSEQVFTDSARQIIVRLTEERLVYAAADGRGWQCRVPDICWTSSRITSRGIQEINLHGAGGRVAATILPFDGIERFYVALLRLLTERPEYALVRHDLPTQVPLLERVVWIAGQREAGEGPLDFLRVAPTGLVAATERSILVESPLERTLERVDWGELAGIRSRAAASRIYRAHSYVEVAVPELEAGLTAIWDALLPGRAALAYSIPGVSTADPELAMEFSWELERALNDELLDPEELVLACAYGRGEGSLLPGEPGAAVPSPMSLGAVLSGMGASDGELTRTELILTHRRLLHIERDRETLELLSQVEVELERLPRVRRVNELLILGRFELLADPDNPGMAEYFMERYRNLVTERFDPFGDHQEEGPTASLAGAGRPDPFAPTLENPISLEG